MAVLFASPQRVMWLGKEHDMRGRTVAVAATGLMLAGIVFAAGPNRPIAARTPSSPPANTVTHGAVRWAYLGDAYRDLSTEGFVLDSTRPAGSVTATFKGLDATKQRWYRFTFRGLPQADFAVGDEGLKMHADFFGDGGKTQYDGKAKPIDDQIAQARQDFTVNGREGRHGAEVWRTYTLDFQLPFAEVDTVKLSVSFEHGRSRGTEAAFFVDGLALAPIPEPANAPKPATRPAEVRPAGRLIPIGGRWSYLAKSGETSAPKTFDATNVDRLLYHDAVYTAPFAGNASAVLRAGFMDASGQVVKQDRLVADNVTITFDRTSMIIKTHGLPNHPTGRFPEQGFGNPSYVQERVATYYFPLNPAENPRHQSTDDRNANGALHMGPIGLAVNGVVFFNPFDMGNVDATDLMDRCCGHPNQDNQYHYHKYPICVNSPWSDGGTGHSPVLGWAFDGLPVYGPYEAEHVMAKDVTGERSLNAFNAHYDADRGWHYHVTPGRFPYLIGGFWAEEDARNRRRPGGPGGMGGPGRRPPPDGGPPR